MNMKSLGRNTSTFYCKKCLKKQFGLSEKQWKQQIAGFIAQGCELF